MKRYIKILQYILALCLAVESNSVYIVNYQVVNQIVLLTTFFVLLILCAKDKKKNTLGSLTPFWGGMYFLWALVLYFNGTGDNTFILKFFFILPLLVLYLSLGGAERFKMILKRVVDTMVFISIVSLFFYLFGTVLEIIPYTSVEYSDWAGTYFPSWFYVYFEAQPFRNCGIYPEAPMYNYVLFIALLTEYFLLRRNRVKMVILVAAILTSTSTTGLLALLGLLLTHVILKFLNGSLSPIQTFFMVLLAIVTFLVVYYLGSDIIEEKSHTLSYTDRQAHIRKALSVFYDNVLLGSGYGKNGTGSSNSLFILLADGGLSYIFVFGFSLIIWPICQFIKKNYMTAAMYGLYFCVFSITIVLYTNMSLLFVSYPLALQIIKKK